MSEPTKRPPHHRGSRKGGVIMSVKNFQGLTGLSSGCTLDPMIALGCQIGPFPEHPCDRCNEDRGVCRGFPRRDGTERGSRRDRKGE